jgi:hypothetical protein
MSTSVSSVPGRYSPCPLLKRGALVALLYLENNLAPNVFTLARIAESADQRDGGDARGGRPQA